MHNRTIENRLTSEFSGTDRKSFKAKLLRLTLGRLKPGTALPVLPRPLGGKRWIVDSSDLACWSGTYQREIRAMFAKTVSRWSGVFVIGSKAGFYSLLASRIPGRVGTPPLTPD